MTQEEKIQQFLMSQEAIDWSKDIAKFLGMGEDYLNDVGKVLGFLSLWISANLKNELLRTLIKFYFNIEDDEKINQLYEYLKQNYFPKVSNLWQEEIGIPEIKEETFEEKEKRYLEIMESAVKKPEIYEEEKKKIVIEPEVEKPKTLNIGFEEKEEVLPEGTVIIKRRDEEEKKEEGEVLDLSNL